MPVVINGSTGISGTDGSAATPAIQGTDTNTGMYFPGNDRIAFAEGGVQVGEFDASGNFLFNSGFGSAGIAYGCRAWVNFNGTGTVAIRGSGNVSSITDHAIGEFSVNMTTAMPDVNYAITAAAGSTGDTRFGRLADDITPRTTTSFRFYIIRLTTTDSVDAAQINVAVFR